MPSRTDEVFNERIVDSYTHYKVYKKLGEPFYVVSWISTHEQRTADKIIGVRADGVEVFLKNREGAL